MDSTWAGALAIHEFGQAKVQNLRLARRRHHDVAGFDVAMDDAARMGRVQCIGDLNRYRESAAQI